MAVIIEDPLGDMRRHAERLDARLRDTERMLRAVLLSACAVTGGPIRVSQQCLLSADIGVRMEMRTDQATHDILFYAHR